MRVTQWLCPLCGPSPLDHFSEDAKAPCLRPCLPPDDAANMLRDCKEDTTHVFGAITATRLLGCARKVAIEDTLPVALDPARYMAAHDGTEKHKALASQPQTSYLLGELHGVQRELTVRGELWGLTVQATIDRLGAQGIIEYKTTKGWAKSNEAKVWPEQQVQVSIQSELARQQLGHALRVRLWYKFWSTGQWAYADVEPLSLDEVAAFKPHGGDYTVREIGEQLSAFYHDYESTKAANQTGVPPEPFIRRLPLAGRKMKFGKKSACEMCLVQRECDRLEGVVTL